MNKTINQVYLNTSSALNSIYKKRRVANLFQKVIWLVFGLWLLFMLINTLSSYLGKELTIIDIDKYIPPALSYYPYKNLLIFGCLIVLYYPSAFLFSYFFKKYKEIEQSTITKMVNTLFPNTDFSLNTSLSTNQVYKSNLFAWLKLDDTIYTYGQMRKRIEGIDLNMADIGITEKNASSKILEGLITIPGLNLLILIYQYTLKNIFTNKSADNVYYTFRGLYSWAQFNKKINGKTIIISNNISSKLDRFASFNFKDEEKIILENTQFQKYFSVYGTSQIEARYVLSISLIEKIVELREKFDRPIMLSFTQNNVFLAVHNPNGFFSFPNGKIDSIEIINELVHEINTVQDVVTDFNLQHQSF